jgi:hypothetical protein
MTKAYDGRQIVGIDLHRRRWVLVRMTEDGRRLDTARITNSAAELCREIARMSLIPGTENLGGEVDDDLVAPPGRGICLADPEHPQRQLAEAEG